MDRILSVTPSGMAAATELTVASLVNPTELNSLGLAVPDWRVCRTVGAGTDDATWYRLDASSAGVSAPYVMASATAGLRWVAIAGRYINSAVAINGALTLPTTPLAASSGGTGQASYVVGDVLFASGVAALSALADVAVGNSLISGGVGVAPAWGKIALTTHVSGILPSANGGTGINNAGSITNASNTIITGGGTLALGGFTLTAPATGTAVLTTTAQSIAGVKTFTDTTSASSSIVGALVVGNGTAATSVAIGAGNINAGGTLLVGGTAQIVGNVGVVAAPAANVTLNSDKTYTTEPSPVRGAQFIARLAVTADSASAAYGGRFDAYATANFNYTNPLAVVGVYGRAQNVSVAGANIVTGVAGGYFDIVNSPSGTISDAHTIRAGAATLSAGAITRLYGLYVDPVTVGGTNYAIYTNAGLVRIGDATSASTSLVGAVVVGNGTAATSVAIGAGNINAGGTLVVGGTSALNGLASVNVAASALSHAFFAGSSGLANNQKSGLSIGRTRANGEAFYFAYNYHATLASTYLSLQEYGSGVASSASTMFWPSGGLTVGYGFNPGVGGIWHDGSYRNNSATDATAIGTASVVQSGGQSTAKNILAGQAIAAGVTSTATAAGTTTLTNASRRTQIFTGATTQTLQMPAANLFGAGVAVEFVVINRSTGSVTASRAGADTFVGGGTTDVITTLTQRYYVSDGVSVWYSLAV